MMKATGIGTFIVFVAALAAFAIDSRLEKTLPQLGQQLLKVTELAGRIQIQISRPSVEDLVKNKEQILKLIKTDLRETVEAIGQFLPKAKPSFSIMSLDPKKRIQFLHFVPSELRVEIEKTNELKLEWIIQIYSTIKNDVTEDGTALGAALSKAVVDKMTEDQVNEIGKARGELTASLGRLVTFSGLVQQLAFIN